MEATLYNGAQNVQPSRSVQHPQLLNLSRGPVFGFISPGKQMHLWLPSDRLVLLLGDITALYDDLATDRLKSVSLQLKKVSFDEYFRDGQSYEDPSSNPSPVETMMVKVAIVSLLGSFFVVVIGALVFGARCGGRRSSDGDNGGDEDGRPGKRKKDKSLEVKSAYWGPLRVRTGVGLLMLCLHPFSFLPLANGHSALCKSQLSSKCWRSIRQPALHLLLFLQLDAQNAPDQQDAHPFGSDQQYWRCISCCFR